MPIRLGEAPQASFEEPLALLSDCHRRIERFLGVLVRVTDEQHGGALTAEQRSAVETALRYFREAAPRHTADEEQSLFPRLRAASTDPALRGSATAAQLSAVLARVEALENEHKIATELHTRVDQLAGAWLRDGKLPAGEAEELGGALHRLQQLYAEHIGVEDREVFPLAAQVLSSGEQAALGVEMALRRGLGGR